MFCCYSIFKDRQTNWKYVLIVVILAIVVGVGILSYSWRIREEIEIPQLTLPKKEKVTQPQLKTEPTPQPEKEEIKDQKPEEREITEEEMLLIFKKIFPKGITKSNIDKIADLKKRAKAFFEGPITGESPDFHEYFGDYSAELERSCYGRISYVELDGKPEVELFIHTYCADLSIRDMPEFGPVYIFRLENKDWNIIGELPTCEYRTVCGIGKIKQSGLADIFIIHWGGGGYGIERYQWDGKKYALGESAICEPIPDPEEPTAEKPKLPKLCEEADKEIMTFVSMEVPPF